MRRLICATAVAVSLAGTSLLAQTPPRSGEVLTVHPEAREAIGKIKSPYCPGLMLEVCSSSGGAMLRDSIQAMAVQGLDAAKIVEAVLAEYGEEWRAEPLRSGSGLWAWLLPPLGLLLGSGSVAVVLARRRRNGPAVEDSEPTAQERERLRLALRQLEELEQPDW